MKEYSKSDKEMIDRLKPQIFVVVGTYFEFVDQTAEVKQEVDQLIEGLIMQAFLLFATETLFRRDQLIIDYVSKIIWTSVDEQLADKGKVASKSVVQITNYGRAINLN